MTHDAIKLWTLTELIDLVPDGLDYLIRSDRKDRRFFANLIRTDYIAIVDSPPRRGIDTHPSYGATPELALIGSLRSAGVDI